MHDTVFEEIKEEHLTEVLEIYKYYILNTSATFHKHVLSKDEMRELVFFDCPKYKTFVIKSGGTICGYVILTRYSRREAFDDTSEVTIYLKPDYMGKGIGSQALQFIEAIARQQNMHVLIATICGENLKSISLFEKNGFTKCAHYKEVGKKFGKLLDIVAYQKILT